MLKQLSILILSILPLASFAASTPTGNPIENKKEANTMQSIQLNTAVGPLAANLYLPKGVANPPLVVVTGAWTTVKEQMPAVYAKALADKGYAALTFDFRGWGQSQGDVRFLEDPTRKTQDIRAVIDAATQLEGINSQRIAGLGVCASSGYMLDAATQLEGINSQRIAGLGVCASSGYMLDAALGNNKLQAVALVAPWLHDKAMATQIYGGQDSVNTLLATAAQAADSAKPMYIEAASTSNENALMYQAPYYTETERGLIPEYDNQFNLASWSGWLNYNAQQSASTIQQPVLMVASEAMALPAGAHQYLKTAGDNVKAVWFDDITQFDFYDQSAAVNKSVDAIAVHFEQNL